MWSSNRYKPIKQIATSCNGSVWLSQEVSTGENCTIKVFDFIEANSSVERHLKDEQRCLEILAKEIDSHLREQPSRLPLPSSRGDLTQTRSMCDLSSIQFTDTPTSAQGIKLSSSATAIVEGNRKQLVSVYRLGPACLRVCKLRHVFCETVKERQSFCAESLPLIRNSSSSSSSCLDYCGYNRVFLVLSYIPGMPLQEYMASKGGVLSENCARFFAAEVVRVLGALHERGIIYRDLKASNIIVGENGRISLIDFGFAKYIGRRGRTISYCGTLHSMAPEVAKMQNFERECLNENKSAIKRSTFPNSKSSPNLIAIANNESPVSTKPENGYKLGGRESYGPEADWWSLGILIYEMIYGKPPFGFHDYEVSQTSTIQDLAMQSPESIDFPMNKSHYMPSAAVTRIIASLLKVDPLTRLGSSILDGQEVEKAAWFSGFPWKMLDDPNAAGILE